METPMITLEHIVKSFAGKDAAVHAVNDVSLTIGRGSIYGIVGFSGAGKSTLVRCINLLERPISGRVFVDGTELTALRGRALNEQRKKIGMIFQQFNLFATRTVFENVAFPLRYTGLSGQQIREKVAALPRIVGDRERVVPGPSIDAKFLSDTLGRLTGRADALVYATSTQEVSSVMRYAWENGIAVTPRGAGTNLVGSTVPQKGGIILDLSRMNHVLDIDGETLTATVEAGVVLQDFQALVESKGLFYPPDPGEKTATIGGNIATNAGGMRADKYGVTRDYVRGLEVVLADGRVMTVGSRNVKDASGLSLRSLFIGSEGTLCVITKCLLRLVPKPETSLSVLVPFAVLQDGIDSVLAVIRANANPTAIEFVERSVVELGERFTGLAFPCPQASACILLTFDGTADQVAQSVERVHAVIRNCGALDFIPLTDPAYAADIWKVRGCLVKAVEAVSEQEPVDLVVPINKTAGFIAQVHRTEAATGMQMVSFGHAGDSNVHLCIVRGSRDEETWARELHEVMTDVYGKAYALGGLTSGEHGIGIAKRPYFLSATPEVNLDVMRAVKTALDEKHILSDHISYLK